ncbi:S8 family serine peptidase [Acidovorax sp. Be4]|uniref:S8 family serine peptidase n=1 Tax=Acidovorax bellezanensis TaxID=2976702 RepID=A0ABT2PGF2_9BURK|nr:S8 family serine peptidase [Acidovorax sp. Be4]MCT9809500.1 S8 family serine peptidase [Acidovorax sp. Be4]
MRRYIILKYIYQRPIGKRDLDTGVLSLEKVLPAISTDTLPEHMVAELKSDPQVQLVVPTMPTRLISPVESKPVEQLMVLPAANWGIKAVRADRSQYDGSGVTVAVLDTGIDRDHPAFAGMTLIEKDFSDHGNGDRHGHGTHCAGTIFGRDEAQQRVGIARGVSRALIGKVLGDDGAGQSEMIFHALNWAMEERADIISMSLGFDFPGMVSRLTADGWPLDLATSTALEAYGGNLRMFDAIMAVLRAQAAFGVAPLVIAAAGNESRRAIRREYRIATSLPAAANDVISVAAVGRTDHKYEVADFSNIQARLAAPGVDITSAWPGGGLRTISGTSMACPHVAGVAALWWQFLRQAGIQPTARNVAARLISNARKDVFVANTDEADIGQGLVTSP